jgi:hypothetical protein
MILCRSRHPQNRTTPIETRLHHDTALEKAYLGNLLLRQQTSTSKFSEVEVRDRNQACRSSNSSSHSPAQSASTAVPVWVTGSNRDQDRLRSKDSSRATATLPAMFTIAHSTLQENLNAYTRSPSRTVARPTDRGPDKEKRLTSAGPAKNPTMQSSGQAAEAARSVA